MQMRKKVDPADIAMWREFKRTNDLVLRNTLIEKYLPLVRYIAERVLSKLPQSIQLDDLQSAGVLGLMDAVRGYDPERGVKFETYCTTRIRGAILDELRSTDWVPRIVRSKANKIDKTFKALEVQLGRNPSEITILGGAPADLEVAQKLEARGVSRLNIDISSGRAVDTFVAACSADVPASCT